MALENTTFFGNNTGVSTVPFSQGIIVPFLVFILIVAIGYLLLKILNIFLLKLTKKTKTDKDEEFIENINPWIFRLIFVIALKTLFFNLGLMNTTLNHIFDSIIIIFSTQAIILFVNFLIDVWTQSIVTKITRNKREITAVSKGFKPLIKRVVQIIIWIISLAIILTEWGINILPILGGLGIAGLAVSLAAQDSLKNFFGGLSIAADKALKIGDMVALPKQGITGVVYDIGLRSTKIKTWDNDVIVIPNGELSVSLIQNYNLPDLSIRVVVPFSVEYGSDVDKVRDVVLKEIKKVPDCLDEPEPVVLFLSMKDYYLDFSARFWVDNISKRFNAQLEAVDRIYKALRRENIGIPFPTRTVYLKENVQKDVSERSEFVKRNTKKINKGSNNKKDTKMRKIKDTKYEKDKDTNSSKNSKKYIKNSKKRTKK